MDTICGKPFGGSIVVWDSIDYTNDEDEVVCNGFSGAYVEDNERNPLEGDKIGWIRTAYVVSLGIYNKELYALTKHRAYRLLGNDYQRAILDTPLLKEMWDALKENVKSVEEETDGR